MFSDGTGYVEDGREIFDEVESDEEEIPSKAKKRKSESSETRSKKLRDVNKSVEGNGSIRKMFGKIQPKKENQVKLDDDDILAGILGEIGPESDTNTASSSSKCTNVVASTSYQSKKSLNAKTEMAIVKEYMQNFNKSIHKKTVPKIEDTNDDVRLFQILSNNKQNLT